MRGARKRKLLAMLLLLSLFLPGHGAQAAQAGAGPDLSIARLVFHPQPINPWGPVTVEVTVENSGDSSSPTAVSLQWCCGRVERPLPTLATGATAVILFEQAMVFVQAGEYTVSVSVDDQQIVAETDENNNSRQEKLTVALWEAEKHQPSGIEWSSLRDEGIPLACPDTDLMRIGRKEPLVMEDRCVEQYGPKASNGCPATDVDGDTVPEGPDWLAVVDLCPDRPGPPGFAGCPRSDRDGDGLADAADECPDQPGPPSGIATGTQRPPEPNPKAPEEEPGPSPEPYPEETLHPGCPVTGIAGDEDGDGVKYPDDQCPDKWGSQSDGCPYPGPEIDDDADGVGNTVDQCRGQYGVDAQGCPQPDTDGDGVKDAVDQCPLEPGPGEGCPAAGQEGDADGDGLLNIMARPSQSCEYDDNQVTDPGCQVYLRGQNGSSCGTTSLAYVARYFGKECCGEPCVQQCVDSEIRSEDIDMFTDPIGLQEYAQSLGLYAEVYVDQDEEDIRSFVDNGVPVLVDIIVKPNSPWVTDGHWVVAISSCEVPQESPGGTTQMQIGFFDPHSMQFAITPDQLGEYWGEVVYKYEELEIPLWNRLIVAVSDEPLPPGNSDQVRAQLALAQGVSTGATGVQDLWNCLSEAECQRLGEGGVEFGTGLVTAVMGLLSSYVGSARDLPLIGGLAGALGDTGGALTLVFSDLGNSIADLLNPSNWTDPAKMLAILKDIGRALLDGVLATLEGCLDLIVDGIGGFFKSIWSGVTSASCDLLDWGCPDVYSYFKHYASTDRCLESTVFANGMWRKEALGYIDTGPSKGTKPIYLLASGPSPQERVYFLCDAQDWSLVTPTVSLGVVGYADQSAPADAVNLTQKASDAGMLCSNGHDLGYLHSYLQDGSQLLWLMYSVEGEKYAASPDSCAGTETFFTPVVEGYTREMAVGLISPSELAGGQKLFRFFNPETDDAMLSLDESAMPDGYVNQGYLGYLYSDEQPGTVPLYQYYDEENKDHLITTDPGAEGLAGYGGQELLGYVFPASGSSAADGTCYVPLWRFCKRVWGER